MSCRVTALLVFLAIGWSGVSATAQDLPSTDAAPAHISFVDGTAVLERDGEIDRAPTSMPLLAGDRVRTEAGRLEVLFVDGSALHLDANTVVDFQSDEVVRLLQGRIRLSIAGTDPDVFYRVDAPSAWVEIVERGEYRVAVLGAGEVELAVLRGSAELVNEQGRSHIRAGERTLARTGTAPSAPYVFNSAAWDGFDRWSEDRRSQRLGTSTQYLPRDVRPYAATFDHYGSWRYEPVHGYVWYPRVSPGWRPYYHGRWATLRPYGWTWIASDPWGWPTHHYGRWGFSAGLWYWIPGRHWGPAWVSWAYASDYVSWCPLGWNNRPVLQINIFAGGRRHNPWDAWTIVPRRHFGGRFVNVASVRSVRIDQRIHNTFVIRDRAPETRYAVSRDVAPIRSAGRFAVPRGSGGTGARASDVRRDLPLGDGARASESRRFPAAARTPGAAGTGRSAGTSGEASSGRRAVSREAGGTDAQGVSRRTTRTTSPSTVGGSPSGRAVSRDGSAAATPGRSSRTAPGSQAAPSAPPQDRSTAGAGVRSRRSSPARPGADGTPASPAGVNRAAPRARPSAGESAAPASPRGAAGNAAQPGRTRSQTAGPPPAAPAPAAATPGATDPAGGSNRGVPSSRNRSPAAGISGSRATPRGRSAPAATPPASYRTAPERAPAAAAPSASPPRSVPRRRAPAAAAPSDPSYRSAPARRAPDSAGPPPSYRAGPERRAPGGGAQSARPSARTVERSAPGRASDRGAAAAAGSTRQSAGEGGSRGRARRRD